jgi:hypothetical protein
MRFVLGHIAMEHIASGAKPVVWKEKLEKMNSSADLNGTHYMYIV